MCFFNCFFYSFFLFSLTVKSHENATVRAAVLCPTVCISDVIKKPEYRSVSLIGSAILSQRATKASLSLTKRDRQTDRQTGRQTDRQTETERQRQRQSQSERGGRGNSAVVTGRFSFLSTSFFFFSFAVKSIKYVMSQPFLYPLQAKRQSRKTALLYKYRYNKHMK